MATTDKKEDTKEKLSEHIELINKEDVKEEETETVDTNSTNKDKTEEIKDKTNEAKVLNKNEDNEYESIEYIKCQIERVWNIDQNDETYNVELILTFYKSLSTKKNGSKSNKSLIEGWCPISSTFSIKNCVDQRIQEYPLKIERVELINQCNKTHDTTIKKINGDDDDKNNDKEKTSLYAMHSDSLRKSSMISSKSLFASKEYNIEATISQNFDIYNFPYDVQDLSITFVNNDENNIKYLPMNQLDIELLNVSPQCFESEEWNLKRTLIEFKNNEVVIRLKYRRNFWIYLLNFFLIIDFITGLSLVQFSLSGEKKEERLAILITLILTSVAFNDQKPKIKQITLLDIFVFINYLFLMMMLIEASFVMDYDGDNGFIDDKIDNYLFYIALAIFIGYNILFIIFSFKCHSFEEEKIYQTTNDIRKRIQANDYRMAVNLQQYHHDTDINKNKDDQLLYFMASKEYLPQSVKRR